MLKGFKFSKTEKKKKKILIIIISVINVRRIKLGALVQPHLHVVQDFEEGEGHASANDHLVDLVQHVIDQLDLVLHLGPEREKEEGKKSKKNKDSSSWICAANGHCTTLNQDETVHVAEFTVKYCEQF